jgi:peptide deformylase
MGKQAKLINGKLVEFEIRDLVDFYDPILRTPTKLFTFEDKDERDIEFYAYSMAMTLDSYPHGLGLSANQIGWDFRICAINLGMQNAVLFNPEIIEASEPVFGLYEGCLSYPGLLLKIPRSHRIKIKFQAPAGNWLEETYEGLTAVCIQHEIDHLNGIVYSDRVSSIALDRAKRKVKTNIKKMNRISKQNQIQYNNISKTVSDQNFEYLDRKSDLRKINDVNLPSKPEVKINFPQVVAPNDVKLVNLNPPQTFVYNIKDSMNYGGGQEIK